ncbi:MAG TPA: hypothetical protein VIM07_00545 [Chitinophagaceae bacterium]
MKIIVILFLVIINTPAYSQVHERWDVKTITDNFSPDFNSIRKITVAKIEPKPKIRVQNTQPRLNFEKQMVSISGTVSRIALESDGDYHIEITDGTMGDSSFVCEAVNPSLSVASGSKMVSHFKTVYKTAKNLKVGNNVEFTGILFQDKFHNPSPNRTRNFVEMHPILIAAKR